MCALISSNENLLDISVCPYTEINAISFGERTHRNIEKRVAITDGLSAVFQKIHQNLQCLFRPLFMRHMPAFVEYDEAGVLQIGVKPLPDL